MANEYYEELKEHFAYPPNVLDEFAPISTIHWLTESQKLQAQVNSLQLQAQDLESQAKRFENEAQHFKSQANRFENEAQHFKSQANYFENEANVFRQSRSWKITSP